MQYGTTEPAAISAGHDPGVRDAFDPTDVEQAVEAISGVRHGSAVAIELDTTDVHDDVAIVVESLRWRDDSTVRTIRSLITAEVTRRFGFIPTMILVVRPGMVPSTPSDELRRSLVRELLPH